MVSIFNFRTKKIKYLKYFISIILSVLIFFAGYFIGWYDCIVVSSSSIPKIGLFYTGKILDNLKNKNYSDAIKITNDFREISESSLYSVSNSSPTFLSRMIRPLIGAMRTVGIKLKQDRNQNLHQ